MDLGCLPSEVSACLLHAAGAIALLVTNVDTNIIQLLGQWHLDIMVWYLHLTAELIIKYFSSRMLNADYCHFPSQLVPQQ
ncbi:hypothetical protein ACHAXS_001056 [Conticribra weissflogii]